MMEDAAKQTKKQPRRDRVTLDPVSTTRLNAWIDELRVKFKGIKITRADLANFIISNHAETLTELETKGLRERYFDELEFARWAVNEIRKARVSGGTLSLTDLVDSNLKGAIKLRRPRPKTPQNNDPVAPLSEGDSNVPANG
jgi:hypothetical protein